MSLTRPAVIMLTTVAPLSAGSEAWAASPTLTPMPPAMLTQGTAAPSPAPQPSVAGRTTGEQATGAIPRTGSDLPLEMLVAALVFAAGGVLRTRLPAGPA